MGERQGLLEEKTVLEETSSENITVHKTVGGTAMGRERRVKADMFETARDTVQGWGEYSRKLLVGAEGPSRHGEKFRLSLQLWTENPAAF